MEIKLQIKDSLSERGGPSSQAIIKGDDYEISIELPLLDWDGNQDTRIIKINTEELRKVLSLLGNQ
jgi:hypothetical protein